MTRITVEIDDLEARKMLGRLIAGGEDLTPLMDEIGDSMVSSTIFRFDQGIAPDGTQWLPSIRAREQGGKTLIDSGALRDSITHRASKNEVVIGTNLIYAPTHQAGATIRAKNGPFLQFRIGGRFARVKDVTIPARPFIGLSRDDKTEIGEIVGDYIKGLAA